MSLEKPSRKSATETHQKPLPKTLLPPLRSWIDKRPEDGEGRTLVYQKMEELQKRKLAPPHTDSVVPQEIKRALRSTAPLSDERINAGGVIHNGNQSVILGYYAKKDTPRAYPIDPENPQLTTISAAGNRQEVLNTATWKRLLHTLEGKGMVEITQSGFAKITEKGREATPEQEFDLLFSHVAGLGIRAIASSPALAIQILNTIIRSDTHQMTAQAILQNFAVKTSGLYPILNVFSECGNDILVRSGEGKSGDPYVYSITETGLQFANQGSELLGKLNIQDIPDKRDADKQPKFRWPRQMPNAHKLLKIIAEQRGDQQELIDSIKPILGGLRFFHKTGLIYGGEMGSTYHITSQGEDLLILLEEYAKNKNDILSHLGCQDSKDPSKMNVSFSDIIFIINTLSEKKIATRDNISSDYHRKIPSQNFSLLLKPLNEKPAVLEQHEVNSIKVLFLTKDGKEMWQELVKPFLKRQAELDKYAATWKKMGYEFD